MSEFTALDITAINTIRTLAMDAVQKANSGHPGAPMGLAPVAYVVWNRAMTYDPADPLWPNRDRFVLSNGHASMLLYSLIHLTQIRDADLHHGKVIAGESLPIDQLKRFRQLNSKTPGHPESDFTAGVETTTGPLGTGVGNAVGMAIAQKWRAAYYGRPGFESLFDHRVYAICGDGCMMEGVASEAASLAGHLKLNNLTPHLRRQRHHHRRAHAPGVQRGRAQAVRGVRVERPPRERRQRHRRHGEGHRGVEVVRPAHLHRAEDGHRVRLAEQGRHARRARRAARCR